MGQVLIYSKNQQCLVYGFKILFSD